MSISEHEGMQAIYDRLWDTSKEHITNNTIECDPVPGVNSKRWGISVIIKPDAQTAQKLYGTIQEMAEWTGPQQVLYTIPHLHSTVRSFEFYRSPVDEDDANVRQYAAILGELAQEFAPMQIAYRGLTATRIGVQVQGFPLHNMMQRLREALHERLRTRGLLHGPEQVKIRDIAHMSLVVFTSSLRDPRSLTTYIEQHRQTDYGMSTSSTLELVYYKRTELEARPVPLATFSLTNEQK